MMNVESLACAIRTISRKVDENKEYLVMLDQQNGDGDLGISMSEGFRAVVVLLDGLEERDLGKVLLRAGNAFNEAAPSSLGTILSFGFMGMARCLKGIEEATDEVMVQAVFAGVERIMEKAGSKPGERTILDSLYPAVLTLQREIADSKRALHEAALAAKAGAEATRTMRPVHGRAAYYGEKSLGHLDGGAVVGQIIFEGLQEAFVR